MPEVDDEGTGGSRAKGTAASLGVVAGGSYVAVKTGKKALKGAKKVGKAVAKDVGKRTFIAPPNSPPTAVRTGRIPTAGRALGKISPGVALGTALDQPSHKQTGNKPAGAIGVLENYLARGGKNLAWFNSQPVGLQKYIFDEAADTVTQTSAVDLDRIAANWEKGKLKPPGKNWQWADEFKQAKKEVTVRATPSGSAADARRHREAERAQEAIQLGPEAMGDEEQHFLDPFVAPVFIPITEDVAKAEINTISQAIIGRNLKESEMKAVMAKFRQGEARSQASQTAIAKATQARQIMADTTHWERKIQDRFEQIKNQYLTRDFGPIAAATMPVTKQQEQQWLRQATQEVQASDPLYKWAVANSTVSGAAGFSAEQWQIDLQHAAGEAAPMEEAGVDLRNAFTGFMQAIGSAATPIEPTGLASQLKRGL